MKTLTLALLASLSLLLAPWQAEAAHGAGRSAHKQEHRHDGWRNQRHHVVPRGHHQRLQWRLHRKLHVYWSDGYLNRWERRDLRHERRHLRHDRRYLRGYGSRPHHAWRYRW